MYEDYYAPGCPDTDNKAGDMGPASANCCYCKNPTVSVILPCFPLVWNVACV